MKYPYNTPLRNLLHLAYYKQRAEYSNGDACYFQQNFKNQRQLFKGFFFDAHVPSTFPGDAWRLRSQDA